MVNSNTHWEKVGKKTHNGIAVSLFSLWSTNSSGIGEFLDLLPLIDWCHVHHFDIIQLLPILDSGDDLSPYNPLSSCALDPIYISISSLSQEGLDKFETFKMLPRIARNPIKTLKIQWLYLYFQKEFPKISTEQKYQIFIEENKNWLLSYALFKVYKDDFGQKSWTDWPNGKTTFNPLLIEEKQEQVNFHCFLQFLCFEQMKIVHEYALQKGIFLKGDIPILVSPDSADVWEDKSLFDLNLAAGAPPDVYNPEGQYWGFPLYNWEVLKESQFQWWKRRLEAASKIFDIYRIDHIIGFFRIWAIPIGGFPKDGHFIPTDTTLWPSRGREILEKMLEFTPILPIGEDLGIVPDIVRDTMKQLEICGTKVIRFERDWQKDFIFIPYDQYEPFSMTTVSTHDSETITGWWNHYPEEAKAFSEFKNWKFESILSNDKLFEILKDSYHTSSMFHINHLHELLALIPDLVSENPDDERINVPGTLLPTNWTYRYRISMEEIQLHEKLNEKIKNLLT